MIANLSNGLPTKKGNRKKSQLKTVDKNHSKEIKNRSIKSQNSKEF